MVLYFSGTGNSQLAAFRLAELIEENEVISINHYLKSGKKAVIRSERPLVFVAPTYSWRMPRVVEQWIRETSFEGGGEAYFILTCAGGCGNAAAYAEKLCREKGLRFRGLAPVIMPENYLALFPTPEKEECGTIIENAEPRIASLAKLVRSGEAFPALSVSLGGKLESGPVNPLFYALFVYDRSFRVSDQCISCGKCAVRCPLNNIDITGGRPVWKGNCTHCMACIGGCPTEAIEYKSKSKGRHHHYIMDDSLCRKAEVELSETRTYHSD
ncbi:EFR1 family ferrodoxin [Anaerolentibacter hominis]|uniref:EFR1 family ferrodoxin n=1 Tax=Anaerolentibacter hominis TaxID=3079009 RepID=UPI0031B83791